MPTPTKFTADRRKRIIEALQIGASRNTAAAVAGIDPATLLRWLQRGKSAGESTNWRKFFLAVAEAEAHPRMRALGVIYRAMEDKPDLAWKFIERRESGYAPPMPRELHSPATPVVIQLSLSDGAQLALADSFIEGEVVSVEDEAAATVLKLPPHASA